MTVTAATLHRLDAGPVDAPALLLAGSLGSTSAMWAPQLGVLTAAHRLIAYDHRGHGRSSSPDGSWSIADLGGDVLALMDDLGLERASFCGTSLGGMVGQWLAASAPERIDRLILIDTSAQLGDPAPWVERARVVREAGSVEPLAEAVSARWLTPAFAAGHPDVADALRRTLATTSAEAYARCCEAIGAIDLRPSLERIDAPTLVIHAREDPSIPFEHGEAIAAAIPGATLHPIAPGAHLPSIEHAALVSRLIATHVAGG